jgi:quinol monooxygenase YgiN
MEGHVSWVNAVTVKAGKLETFRELMEEMVSRTSNEPGTLAYEWYISPDGGTVHVVETYADSAAVVAHHVSEGFALKNWAGGSWTVPTQAGSLPTATPTRQPARSSTASAPPTTPPGAASRAASLTLVGRSLRL